MLAPTHTTNKPPGKRIPITIGRLCQKCTIRIFSSQAQAQLAGVPWQPTVNLNLNGRCPHCAGINTKLFQETLNLNPKFKKEINMNNQIEFADVELNTTPPQGIVIRGNSKYDQITQIFQDSPAKAWHRVKLPDQKTSNALTSHLRKQLAGRKWSFRNIPNETGVYFYWHWTEKPKPAEEGQGEIDQPEQTS